MEGEYFGRVLFLVVCVSLVHSACGPAVAGLVYWEGDFEAYPLDETIHQKGTSWTSGATNYAGWDGYVKIPPGEADKALQLRAPGDGRGAVIWWNDTGLKPTGVQELWFSFKPPETYSFSVEVVGEDAAGEEQTIAYLAHNRAGSARSFYARTTQPCTSTTSPGFRNRLPYCFSPPAVCACDESDAWGLAERSGVVKPPTWQTSKGHLRAAFAFSPSHGARLFLLWPDGTGLL